MLLPHPTPNTRDQTQDLVFARQAEAPLSHIPGPKMLTYVVAH